jgi:hypothetical protein
MSEGAGKTGFETQLAEYKEMVKLRQEECVKIAELLETESRVLSGRAKQLKMALIVLGVIVATKGGLEAAMTDFGAGPGTRVVLGLAFLIFGAVISVIAGIEAGFRFESRAGELRSLSSLCRSYDRRFMSDYKRHIDPANPEVTLAKLGALIDLQNESLDHIRHRSDNLSVDLSAVKVSYRLSDPGQNRAAPV